MGGFVEAAQARVHRARAALAAAEEAGDVYAVVGASDELEDALRVAREHDVDVEGGE
ncbi:hypothetical protein [Streptomyces roseoverticillatus]|uniref:hypothetical protein n=1 Tax=Streptomyces roseoverticillatus TaxID=66429 RepID=UPI000AF048DB|nr:hypothetical protein [Streptomyces roseoverticillatus]